VTTSPYPIELSWEHNLPMRVRCDHFVVGDRETAQAREFVRALRDRLHEMTTQLARIERQSLISTRARACAMRLEAASLRRDINEAQVLIDRLQRHYLDGDERPQQRPPNDSQEPWWTGKPSNSNTATRW